jgi:hypothetical protein
LDLFFVQGTARPNILICRDPVCCVSVDELPPLLIHGPQVFRNARKLTCDGSVVQVISILDAAWAKRSGIEHCVAEHLENFLLENMRADPELVDALKEFDPVANWNDPDWQERIDVHELNQREELFKNLKARFK